jgi:heterodisulfide reductase subunit B
MDAYQSRVNAHFKTEFQVPIVFFTQMLGVAFGLDPDRLGFGKEIVAARPVLEAKLGPAPVAAG